MPPKNKTETIAFGDFQTPPALAREVALLLRSIGLRPKAILEPTCGRGTFVAAASIAFPEAESIVGVEINGSYVEDARRRVSDPRVRIFEGDFFSLNWSLVVPQSLGPWLVLGNPPWVTNSKLGSIAVSNAPIKRNERQLTGIEAVTGKSNFDISEWMLLQYLSWLNEGATIAVLCKVTVARKVLAYAWAKSIPIEMARIYRIDAMHHFNVAVDACLFFLKIEKGHRQTTCEVYNRLDSAAPSGALTYIDGQIVKHASDYRRGQSLLGTDPNYQWRSGIKHDCSKVMELTPSGLGYRNGFEEQVEIEETYIYPMLKSSDLGSNAPRNRKMLVPQKYPGEDMSELHLIAPKTWDYLFRHREQLRKRASSIYRGKGDFAIFGVGPYSFTPWKVAISGFYKQSTFKVVGLIDNRPAVFDDTIYYISCYSEEEAVFMADLLNSEITQNLLESIIHWENKRPITVDILKQISLAKIAQELGRSEDYSCFVNSTDVPQHSLRTYGLFSVSGGR